MAARTFAWVFLAALLSWVSGLFWRQVVGLSVCLSYFLTHRAHLLERCLTHRLDLPLSPQEAAGQECSAKCQCSSAPPKCPPGVSLVLDGCGCCRVCAKQLGDLCTEQDPCDPHKGLFCDFGSPTNHKIGVCTGE